MLEELLILLLLLSVSVSSIASSSIASAVRLGKKVKTGISAQCGRVVEQTQYQDNTNLFSFANSIQTYSSLQKQQSSWRFLGLRHTIRTPNRIELALAWVQKRSVSVQCLHILRGTQDLY